MTSAIDEETRFRVQRDANQRILKGRTRLNLACGNRIMAPDLWLNHDRYKHRDEVEFTHDLRRYPWPWPSDAFEEILAFDIMEHLPEVLPFIEELWRVCQDKAKVTIHTAWASPHVENRHVWRDPTHVRPFTEDSLKYFDPENGGLWFENYGRFYSHARFRTERVQYEPPDNILFEITALKDGI